jgi:hypothetical protein
MSLPSLLASHPFREKREKDGARRQLVSISRVLRLAEFFREHDAWRCKTFRNESTQPFAFPLFSPRTRKGWGTEAVGFRQHGGNWFPSAGSYALQSSSANTSRLARMSRSALRNMSA